MQTVSENWKNTHKQSLLNESFVEVSLDIADPDSLADASSQDNGAVYISDTSEVINEVDKDIVPYCTLEQNLWLLSGDRKAIPESDYGENGYVGDVLSDDVCVFSTKTPTITINFTKVFENLIPGITITWSNAYGEFADSFIVTAYNGDTVVAEKEVIGNRSIKSLVMVDIVNYDRIVIQIKKWCLPYHRARVEEIFVGMNKVYSKTELFDYSHSQSVDPISTALPKTEINFSISNVDGEYNPYNEEGMAKYLMSRQEVKARYGLKLNDGSIEWIKGGTFYLSEWFAKQNGMTADFTARDLLEFMSNIYEDSHDLSPRTLYDLAEKVLIAADLPLNNDGTVKWVIDDSLKSITTTAPLPQDTLANCLQVIANAGKCVLYQDRNGTLHIEPLKFDATDYKIDSFNSYSKSEITIAKPIKEVKVKVYQYTMGEKEVENTSMEVAVNVGAIGETIVIDNPLVTDSDRASAIGTWIGGYLGHRMTLDSSWRADVRLDALDIVTNENSYNTNKVRMTDVKFSFNGAFRGTGEGKVI
jgi:hypothetical protein